MEHKIGMVLACLRLFVMGRRLAPKVTALTDLVGARKAYTINQRNR